MISNAPSPARTKRSPLRALEPQDRLMRAGLVAVRWKRGNPHCNRRTLRVAQRFALGLAKPAVARAEGTDESAIDALLAQDGFAEIVASWQEILDESSPEFMARLEKLCRIALTNALAEWDVGAALFARREMNQGRDPARTLARRVRAQAGRTPPPPPVRDAAPPSPPRPEADYDPLDALVARSAAGLKQSVVLEQAIQSAATAEPDQGNAALEATAREALALQSATASPRPALIALRHGLFARVDTFEIVEAAHGAHPVAAEPRRTRAP